MASRCPSCGGRARFQVAPGYWECQSDRLVGMQGYGARQTPIFEVCRTRYQGASVSMSAGQCFCSTFAIGTCTECESQVCGDHSTLHYGVRLCYGCASRNIAAEKAATTQARKAQLKKEREESADRLSKLTAAVEAAQSSLAKRQERKVRVATLAARTFHSSGGMSGQSRETREPYFCIEKELGYGWLVAPGLVLLDQGVLYYGGSGAMLTSTHPYNRWNTKRELRLAAGQPVDLRAYVDSKAASEIESVVMDLEAIAAGRVAVEIDKHSVVWSPQAVKPANTRDYRGWYLWLLVVPGFYPALVSIAGQSIDGFEPAGLADAMYVVLPATVLFVVIMARRNPSR
jgi:hypothetical protein